MHMIYPSCSSHTACVSQIPAGDFNPDPNTKQYVYIKARFPDIELEKLVLLSFQSGYIYIQTDKTLYTPNSKGEFNTNTHRC